MGLFFISSNTCKEKNLWIIGGNMRKKEEKSKFNDENIEKSIDST